jgi:hypothetical protein
MQKFNFCDFKVKPGSGSAWLDSLNQGIRIRIRLEIKSWIRIQCGFITPHRYT